MALTTATEQVMLLELRVPWEDQIDEANERKSAKYQELVQEFQLTLGRGLQYTEEATKAAEVIVDQGRRYLEMHQLGTDHPLLCHLKHSFTYKAATGFYSVAICHCHASCISTCLDQKTQSQDKTE